MSSGVAGVRKMILASGIRSKAPALLVKFIREFYHNEFGCYGSKKNTPVLLVIFLLLIIDDP